MREKEISGDGVDLGGLSNRGVGEFVGAGPGVGGGGRRNADFGGGEVIDDDGGGSGGEFMAGGHAASDVALNGEHERLVQGRPVLHSVSEFPETYLCIFTEILPAFRKGI